MPPYRIALLATLTALAACAQHGAAGGFGQSGIAAPNGKMGVVMLNIPAIAPEAFGDAQAFGLKLIQFEPAGDGRVLDATAVTLNRRTAPGFVTQSLAQGDYYIRAADVPYKGYCLGARTLAFHVSASKFTVLGTLNAPAILTRLTAEAAADAAGARTFTTKLADGHDSFARDAELVQSPDFLLPPHEAIVTQARAYVDSKLGAGSEVAAVQYRPISRRRDPRNGVDACGALPHRSIITSMAVKFAAPDALLLAGVFPKRTPGRPFDPGDMAHDLGLTPVGDKPDYSLKLSDDLVYVDPQCRETSRAAMFAATPIGPNSYVQLTSFLAQNGTAAAPTHIRLFKRFSDDMQSCRIVTTGTE